MVNLILLVLLFGGPIPQAQPQKDGRTPMVIEYRTDRASGWSVAGPNTTDEQLLRVFKVTPNTVVFVDGKGVATYPEPRGNYKIIKFRLNSKEDTFEAVSLKSINGPPVDRDFKLGGK